MSTHNDKISSNSWMFDVARLKEDLTNVKSLGNAVNRNGLSGLALTSKTGEVFNGFEFTPNIMYPQFKDQTMSEQYPVIYFDMDQCKKYKVYHMLDYVNPTPALIGIFKDINQFLQESNMNPCRMRLSCLPAKGKFPLHSDGGGFKIHIPIITNPDVIFCIDGTDNYLEEGRAYIVDVGVHHYYVNNSDYDRWHLICDVYDTGGNFNIGTITLKEFETEKENAELWRNVVDGLSNTPTKIRLGNKNI